MSYLIALYVYYHGNNLAVFGVTKGAREEDLNNTGIKHPEEINPDLVSRDLIQAAIEQEEKEKQTKQITDWNEMMRAAIQKSQQETFQMYQSGGIQNTVFNSTPDAVVESYEDEGSIPLDFFSSINGM